MRRLAIQLVLTLMSVALLSSCATPHTYADTEATATAAGCWPGDAPTPLPVTVTPFGGATATSFGATPVVGLPTITPLPTTTPYVQCTPAPGETVRPWPTPPLPRPAFPTPEAVNQPRSTTMQTIMQLPEAVLSVDIAAHPLTGDPVVAAIAAPMTQEGHPHVFVRAYNGKTATWGATQNVDVGASTIGQHRFRSVAVTVSGDGAITAVWGATAYPAMEIWASSSRDNGETWDEPLYLTDNAFGVLDVASTLDGRIAVLALQREPLTPILITRDARGVWSAPDPIPVPSAWYGSSGSVVISGDGDTARVVTLTTAFRDAPNVVFVASRSLRGGDAWRVGSREIAAADRTNLVGNVRGIVVSHAAPDGSLRELIAFTFVKIGSPDVFTLVSNDGGMRWTPITRLTTEAEGAATRFSALAYDAAAQRLVAFWTCCEEARWGSAASTHYGAWSVPGSDDWQPRERAPVITGAAAAADTAVAQAANSRFAWLAWIENGNMVAARAIDLNRIIDSDQYPTPTIPSMPMGVQP